MTLKNQKQYLIDVDATHERTPRENKKLRRNQEEREKYFGPTNYLPQQNAASLNEKDDRDEMEDLYRDEENRGPLEAA